MKKNNETILKQVKVKDRFIKIYIANIDFFQSLNGSEIKILLYSMKNLGYLNSFSFNSDFVGYFQKNNILKKTAFYNNFKSLIKKQIFIKVTDEIKKEYGLYGKDIYFVHPDIVGLKAEKLKNLFIKLKN